MAKEKKEKINIYKILCIILLIVLIVVLVIWGKSMLTANSAENVYDRLSQEVNDISQMPAIEDEIEVPDEPNILDSLGIEVPAKNLDWSSLANENEDIYAWIYIPNTNIDYPVLQHPSDNEYYLNHNLDGSRGKPACIYSENYNHKTFTDYNTVLYGHNMKSGMMFGSLHNFEDGNFFDENRYVYIYTPDGVKVYEIFAAYTDNDAHILYVYDFSTEESYQNYLDHVFAQRDMASHFRDGVKVDSSKNILTLSTCAAYSDERYIVQAVLINQ